MQDMVWTCKDGRSILVSQMETSHIINCIAKIERSRRCWRIEYLERLRLELFIRDLGAR